MNFESTSLLDCGHVGQTAGICQYTEHDDDQGCADQVCDQCIAVCDTCRRVLCPRHAVRLDDGTQVYCPDHVKGYVARTLLSAVLDR